jgi:hypothetical protein
MRLSETNTNTALWKKKVPRRFCGSRSSGGFEKRRGREREREVREREREEVGLVSRSEAASLIILVVLKLPQDLKLVVLKYYKT